MLNLRIVGSAWLALGILGAGAALFNLARDIVAHAFRDAIESDFIALAFCVAAAIAGYRLLGRRRWARVACGAASILLLLYAWSYFLMVGLEFGILSLVLISTAGVFSVYSFISILLCGRAG